jgi:hypothetical protein
MALPFYNKIHSQISLLQVCGDSATITENRIGALSHFGPNMKIEKLQFSSEELSVQLKRGINTDMESEIHLSSSSSSSLAKHFFLAAAFLRRFWQI